MVTNYQMQAYNRWQHAIAQKKAQQERTAAALAAMKQVKQRGRVA